MDLREWTTLYIKHKDAMQRKLVSLEEKDGALVCTYKDRAEVYLPLSLDAVKDATLASPDGVKRILVCENTRKNLDTLIARWDAWSHLRHLFVIFVNLARNEKWMISPYTHSQIAEKDALEPGLLTLFANCNGKIEEAPKRKKGMFADVPDEEEE